MNLRQRLSAVDRQRNGNYWAPRETDVPYTIRALSGGLPSACLSVSICVYAAIGAAS